MSTQPNPDVVRRLDAFICAALAEKEGELNAGANVCRRLQRLLSHILKQRGAVLWPQETQFSERVADRTGGLNMTNFLREVQESYGDYGFRLVVIAINSPQLAAWLNR